MLSVLSRNVYRYDEIVFILYKQRQFISNFVALTSIEERIVQLLISDIIGELAESRQTEVTIRDIDENAMDLLIDFCYTSSITVEENNVQTLLPAACLLQLAEIQVPRKAILYISKAVL